MLFGGEKGIKAVGCASKIRNRCFPLWPANYVSEQSEESPGIEILRFAQNDTTELLLHQCCLHGLDDYATVIRCGVQC